MQYGAKIMTFQNTSTKKNDFFEESTAISFEFTLNFD